MTQPSPSSVPGAATDPAALPLDELRRVRAELQHEDDAVSYARRVAQARLDLVTTLRARRERPHDAPRDDSGRGELAWSDDLGAVLAQHLTGEASRPPRPADDLSGSDVATELDAICAAHGFSRLEALDGPALDALARALEEFERRISSDRRARFDRIDALTAELVRRYRDGEATVDTLLAD